MSTVVPVGTFGQTLSDLSTTLEVTFSYQAGGNFIWGILFKKETFTAPLTVDITVHLRRDGHASNVWNPAGHYSYQADGREWVNPDLSDMSSPFQLTFDPADMDEGGCIWFKQPSDPTKILGFVANAVRITGVSGDMDVAFDLLGTSINYADLDDREQHWITNTNTPLQYIGNFYFTGKYQWKYESKHLVKVKQI